MASASRPAAAAGGKDVGVGGKAATKRHEQPHFFPSPALDHAFSGIVAGTAATICMNPLDLIKVQFQVNTQSASSSSSSSSSSARDKSVSRVRPLARKVLGIDVMRDMGEALRSIVKRDGYSGLYRGLSPNVVGNSASWGLYFLFYTMIKEQMASNSQGENSKLSPGQHLLAASESGAITALITNPIWVVKTRMFTTSKTGEALYQGHGTAQQASKGASSATSGSARLLSTSAASIGANGAAEAAARGAETSKAARPAPAIVSQAAKPQTYNGLIDGLRQVWRHEGIKGLYKGGGLALVGVSNGAIQFMTYEELKRWRMSVARAKLADAEGFASNSKEEEAIKLGNSEYLVMSGVSKLAAIGLTYPYQVVRSRIQNHGTAHLYPNVPACIRLTWRHEGLRGFYKGMAANAVRILPGTCVTFVVYENCSWALRGLAERREAKRQNQRLTRPDVTS